MTDTPKRRGGPASKCTPELIAKAVALLADGHTMEEAAQELAVTYAALVKYRKRFRKLWSEAEAKYPGIKRPDVARPAVKESQRDDLLAAAEFIRGEYATSAGPVSKADWWRAFISASLDTGLTRTALMRLRFRDIPTSGMVVFKGNHGEPIVKKLSQATLTKISLLEGKRQNVFENHVDYATFGRDWASIARRAGIQGKLPRLNPRNQATIETKPVEVIEPGGLPATITAFLEEVYSPLKLVGRSPRTLQTYRETIRKFEKWLGRIGTLNDWNDDTVCRYLTYLRKKGLAPHTIVKERDQTLAMWRFACQRRMILEFPNVPKIKAPLKAPEAWSIDEVRRIFVAISELEGRIGNVKAREWWAALIVLIWISGERIGAIMSLTPADVDLAKGWLTVRAELRKGHTEDKRSPIPEYAKQVLAKVCGPENERLLPWPYAAVYLWDRFGRILRKAGLPNTRRDKFHKLRRSVASYFEAAGGDACKMLGHSHRRVTDRHYIDERIVRKVHAADLLPNPMIPAAAATPAPAPAVAADLDAAAWL